MNDANLQIEKAQWTPNKWNLKKFLEKYTHSV